jgi:predicted dehydrogenase
MNAAEAGEMLRWGETKKLTHMTAFNFRFLPAFQQMKSLIQEGYVGKRIQHVEAVWFAERRSDPARPFGWRDQKETVGYGAMGDIGVHLVDLVRWLAGDLKKVSSQQAIFTKERLLPGTSHKREVTVEDCCIFIGELAGGGLVSFSANGAARGGSYQEIRVLGNDGMLRVEIDRARADWMIGSLFGAQGNDKPDPLPIPQSLTSSLAQCDEREAMAQFIFSKLTRAFAHGIRTGEPVTPSFQDGLEAQRILDAAAKSAQSSQWVAVHE